IGGKFTEGLKIDHTLRFGRLIRAGRFEFVECLPGLGMHGQPIMRTRSRDWLGLGRIDLERAAKNRREFRGIADRCAYHFRIWQFKSHVKKCRAKNGSTFHQHVVWKSPPTGSVSASSL